MTYTVTIGSTKGAPSTYLCGGASDQVALIYAGKVVEANADASDPSAEIIIKKDGEKIGPAATVRDMTTKAVATPTTRYTLDLSGHQPNGKPGVNRFGGLFATIADAVALGRDKRSSSRLPFRPEVLWVRDEENNVVQRERLDRE